MLKVKRLGVLLHWYQPPWQYPEVLDRIVDECYRPLSRALEEHPVRCSVDLCWSLVDQLVARGHDDVLTHLSAAARAGHVEFVETAAYHPILPLLPPGVAARQLRLNQERNRTVFGRAYQPRGVFPPELAWSPALAPVLHRLGYRWTITDDVAVALRDGEPPAGHTTMVEGGLRIVLRSNRWSNAVAFGTLDGACTAQAMTEDLESRLGGHPGYLLLAMDAETFGHHRRDYISFVTGFAGWCKSAGHAAMSSVGDIVEGFPSLPGEIPATSWSVLPDDVRAGIPYPLWDDGGALHRAGWELVHLAAETTAAHPGLQAEFDRAISSCAFWWLSRSNWEPELARRGFSMLVDVVQRTGDSGAVEHALTLYDRIFAHAGARGLAS
ncbi:hypothetical protein EPN52_10500 [bacterium]|nr:MAG: hypothetical protein EPN52_10500 [bacterium]